jgi:integrase
MAGSLFKVTVVQHWVYDCWVGADGRPCAEGAPGAKFVKARKVPAGTPGAIKVNKKSGKWYGRIPGGDKPVPLSANKVAAQQLLAATFKKAELARAGIADPFECHRSRPLVDHLDDYRRFLEAEGNCPQYVAKTYARTHALIGGCGFSLITELFADKVTEFLHELRRDAARPALPPGQEWFTPGELNNALRGKRPPHLARVLRREGLAAQGNGKARRYPRTTVEALQDRFCRGIGVSTSNGYLTAIKGFSRWLYEQERTDRDRLVSLSRLNAKTDPRHERRALSETELRAILAAAAQSPDNLEGLNGNDRHMLYATAMVTGFRASELASLSPSDFDLSSDRPTVTVKAAYSKNRRQSVQPLPPDVAGALRGYLADRPTGRVVWNGTWNKNAAEMLRADLGAAGIPYRDSAGRVADFHALRHSYITLLERSGVSPKLAQELARHSDIRLTMNVYTHARLHDLVGAVEGLPTLIGHSPPQPQILVATGTEPVCTGFVQTGDTGRIPLRPTETTEHDEERRPAARNPKQAQEFKAGCDDVRPSERKLPGQDSNLDKENQNHFGRFCGCR